MRTEKKITGMVINSLALRGEEVSPRMVGRKSKGIGLNDEMALADQPTNQMAASAATGKEN